MVRDGHRVGDLYGNLDMFLADVLHLGAALLFVKLLLHKLILSFAVLFFCGSADLFGNVDMGHVTGLVHKGLASVDNLGLVPRTRSIITIGILLLILMFTVFYDHDAIDKLDDNGPEQNVYYSVTVFGLHSSSVTSSHSSRKRVSNPVVSHSSNGEKLDPKKKAVVE